ncbi:ABC transporter permease [Alkaliphilus peptidifermentans]|uniref:NitT/TauT family transport system permease protein n=1 Tax=Alkaliphilus peptidifermentans DSM 18978 TaxID=1120976 RepID=A0A1G5L0H4_9FIRM|nr:ABC transporter permease subunit [Alkaliphilus peptidifermentans]SCZ06453.1 NitT/TauT family transport system permease protein [Alkaliphilus peptidifermentans DSM 18978]
MKDSIIKKINRYLSKTLVFVFWIAVWQIIHLVIKRDIYVPSPINVFITLVDLVLLPIFWKSVFTSIYRVIIGLLISIIIGVLVGIVSSLNRHIYQIVSPLITVIKSTPVLSFIIIALIWISSSNVPIFICVLMCFPVIWTNVVTGICNIDDKLIQMAKVYRVNRLIVLKEIYLPSIKPYLTAAVITSLGLGWKVTVAAEVLSHPRNAIGSNLYSAKVYLESNELFAWTFVVILLSLLFEGVFTEFMEKSQKINK